MLRQAVILAGGMGTRLGILTRNIPKPVLDIGGKPFLEYLIWNLKRFGIKDIILSVGYLADVIMQKLGDGTKYGVKINYSIEENPAGTAGALKVAEPLLEKQFLLLNGDTLFDVNYLDLELCRQRTGTLVAMALREVEDVSRYGSVNVDEEIVNAFGEKNLSGPGYINAGIYAVHRSVIDFISGQPCSFEREILPQLVGEGLVSGLACNGFFIDIGVPDDLEKSRVLVPRWRHKPAVFFDRDGVLNYDRGYVHTAQEFKWVPGAIEAVKKVNDAGYLAIVITNQAGIARGYYTEKDFLKFSEWINEELRRHGAHIDATYYCPHHPTDGLGIYNVECDCRKPKPGMLLRAIKDWDIDVSRSVFFGDNISDIEAAEAAGVKGALVKEGEIFAQVSYWIKATQIAIL